MPNRWCVASGDQRWHHSCCYYERTAEWLNLVALGVRADVARHAPPESSTPPLPPLVVQECSAAYGTEIVDLCRYVDEQRANLARVARCQCAAAEGARCVACHLRYIDALLFKASTILCDESTRERLSCSRRAFHAPPGVSPSSVVALGGNAAAAAPAAATAISSEPDAQRKKRARWRGLGRVEWTLEALRAARCSPEEHTLCEPERRVAETCCMVERCLEWISDTCALYLPGRRDSDPLNETAHSASALANEMNRPARSAVDSLHIQWDILDGGAGTLWSHLLPSRERISQLQARACEALRCAASRAQVAASLPADRPVASHGPSPAQPAGNVAQPQPAATPLPIRGVADGAAASSSVSRRPPQSPRLRVEASSSCARPPPTTTAAQSDAPPETPFHGGPATAEPSCHGAAVVAAQSRAAAQSARFIDAESAVDVGLSGPGADRAERIAVRRGDRAERKELVLLEHDEALNHAGFVLPDAVVAPPSRADIELYQRSLSAQNEEPSTEALGAWLGRNGPRIVRKVVDSPPPSHRPPAGAAVVAPPLRQGPNGRLMSVVVVDPTPSAHQLYGTQMKIECTQAGVQFTHVTSPLGELEGDAFRAALASAGKCTLLIVNMPPLDAPLLALGKELIDRTGVFDRLLCQLSTRLRLRLRLVKTQARQDGQ